MNASKNQFALKLMIKMFSLIIIFIISFSQIYSQSYYYVINRGISDDYYPFQSKGNHILDGPTDDVLSEIQTLPFEWNFYGSTVSQFRASDNGYITFDLSETNSNPDNTMLPSAAAPKNTIFALWDELNLPSQYYVETYTVGVAPNRIFVIQWKTTTSTFQYYVYFAIRIYEKGDFDIILQQRYSAAVVNATVGCSNSDGSLATMVQGSPNFTFNVGTYIKENISVYTFKYGVQPKYDVKIIDTYLPKVISQLFGEYVSVNLINQGAETIDSLTMQFQSSSTGLVTSTIKQLNKTPNSKFSFMFINPIWKPRIAGEFDTIKIWVSQINGHPDEVNEGDTIRHVVFGILGYIGKKKVLIEEFSTTPCGFCPEGHLYLEGIMRDFPNVIGMIHHSGYLTDSMTIPESVIIADEMANGAPTACIDRVLWPDNIRIAVGRDKWSQMAQSRLQKLIPVKLSIENKWENTTRTLDIDVDVEFKDYVLPENLTLTVFVIEDSVTGQGEGYDQANYYNEQVGHPFYGKGNPIVGYVHRHVIRAVPSGTWGENIFDSKILPGQKYNRKYTYILPQNYKEQHISTIAFVSYNNVKNREILNAEESHPDITDIPDISFGKNLFAVYPQPISNKFIVSFQTDKSFWGTIILYNSMGNKIDVLYDGWLKSGYHRYEYSRSNFSIHDGIYYLKLQAGDNTSIAKLLLIK